jgi:hypothetical protein
MPEMIDFMLIPKVDKARTVWRTGMRKLEEVFAEHIANMNLDFEDKFNSLKTIQTQVEHNLSWIDLHYIAMQTKLNEKHALLHQERDAWEAEQEIVRQKFKYDSPIIKLNVGGTHKMAAD